MYHDLTKTKVYFQGVKRTMNVLICRIGNTGNKVATKTQWVFDSVNEMRRDAFYLRLFYIKLLIYSFLQYIFGWRSGRAGNCFRNIAMWGNLQHVIGLCKSGCRNLHMSWGIRDFRSKLVLNIFVQFKSFQVLHHLLVEGYSSILNVILYYLLFSD